MSEKTNNTAVPKRNMVYIISIAITFALVFWGLVSPQSFGAFAKILNGGLTSYYGCALVNKTWTVDLLNSV